MFEREVGSSYVPYLFVPFVMLHLLAVHAQHPLLLSFPNANSR